MSPLRAVALAVASLLGIAALDWATGNQLGFFVFYFVPVALAAWWLGAGVGIGMSVCAAAAWLAIESLQPHPGVSPLTLFWNTAIRLVSFGVIALTMARVQALLARQRQLNVELASAMAQVKQLRGLLPICATCKKIRNDHGYWEQLEVFIEEHSGAAFTHGICPGCLERLYDQLDRADRGG